jgi:hypothetical protein
MNISNENTQLIQTARWTGIWYLGLAVTGLLGFVFFHPQVFVSGDPESTLANLIELESTARIRLLLEFAIVVCQAFAAVYFYKLFKNINEWAAWTLGLWGMINAIMIMISAVSIASAIGIATGSVQSMEDKIVSIYILQNLIANAWGVGSLFFGLWLLPMGYIVIKSKRMPVWLGRTLLLGGFGYIVNVFIGYSGIDFDYSSFLTLPATIGEFWIIGYLLIFGIRPLKD